MLAKAIERSQMSSRRAVAKLSPTVGLHLNVVSVSLFHKPYVVHLTKTKNMFKKINSSFRKMVRVDTRQLFGICRSKTFLLSENEQQNR
jgi:hypothetical protein